MEYLHFDYESEDVAYMCWKEYVVQLKRYWEEVKSVKKEWEQLNWYEQDRVKDEYEKHLEMENERINNPTKFYMLEGRKSR